MQRLKNLGEMILCALIAAGAGGMGGTVALLLLPQIESLRHGTATLGGVLIALPLTLGIAFFFGLFGSVFGMVLGFIPAFIIGAALTQLARWRGFRAAWFWTLVGGAAGYGLAMTLPLEWPFASKAAWTAGGMTAMITYWGLGFRVFQLSTFRASFIPER